MRDDPDLFWNEPTCVCGCPNGGSHVDYIQEWLEPCSMEGCEILLCGSCKCPTHGVLAKPSV